MSQQVWAYVARKKLQKSGFELQKILCVSRIGLLENTAGELIYLYLNFEIENLSVLS